MTSLDGHLNDPLNHPGEDDALVTRWFTFGFDHAHVRDDYRYDVTSVVQITAADPRSVMLRTFGRAWAFEYDEVPDTERYYPRGVKILPGYEAT